MYWACIKGNSVGVNNCHKADDNLEWQFARVILASTVSLLYYSPKPVSYTEEILSFETVT